MQRYDSYKPSGIYFLSEFPSGWKIRKGKYLFNEENRPVHPGDEIVTCFRDGQVTLRKNRRVEGFTNSLKEIGYQGVRKGDLVIHNMDAFAGAIGISDSDGKATPVYSCCTPQSAEISQYYYCYLLRYLARNGFILSLAKGIRERSTDFRFNDFKELYLPVPSRAEQDAIVSYLDTATAKIDSAIAQQQKMIDLLNERKQIIINNAVTKGLNPNAKMKDSGVEWIGEVPKEWDFVKLKHLTKIISKGTTPSTIWRDVLSNGTIRFLKAENIVNNAVCEKPEFYIDEVTHSILKRSNLLENDLLFVIAGATIGKVAILPKELTPANTNQAISFVRLQNPEMSKYVWYVLQSEVTRNYIWSNAVQSAQPNISMEDLGNIQVPIPNVLEQKEIIAYIETKISPIENTIRNCQQQISFLQERKQIIINEVVTGKVKVV